MADDTYIMMVNGKPERVDLGPMLARFRRAHIEARAAEIDQAADAFMCDALDPGETFDAAEAAGMPDGMLDSAGHIAVTLREIELGR